MLVTLSCYLLAICFDFLGPAWMLLHATFFLSPFAFLRLTVGRVSELLIRMLPHGLSDASA